MSEAEAIIAKGQKLVVLFVTVVDHSMGCGAGVYNIVFAFMRRYR